jgi:lipoyl(octanoyl) transferase
VGGLLKDCFVVLQGCVEYQRSLNLQMYICEAKKAGFESDVLLLLEHPHTITLGRNGRWDNLLVSDEELRSQGVRRFAIDRGGDITYHGPGQLVGYPILQLSLDERDVHKYMENLEQSLARLLAGYGIEGRHSDTMTGVWTSQGKIGAMGVHISRWVTRHGFALNVNTDLSFFELIVPCGIVGGGVTSMNVLLGHPVDMREVAERYITEFGTVFNRRMIRIPESDLLEKLKIHARAETPA